MKIDISETVSVEVETTVDVDINEVLIEFSRRLDFAERTGDLPCMSAFLPLLDFATKLMARIPAKGIGKCTDSQRAEVVKRLQAEVERWNAIYVSAED